MGNGISSKISLHLPVILIAECPLPTSVAMSLELSTFRICPIKYALKMGRRPDGQPDKVNTRKLEIFVKVCTYPVSKEGCGLVHEENNMRSFVEVIQSTGGSKGPFAKSGDSGSGVYAVTEDSRNFVFCGTVIG
ncbi:hypothetical protein BGX38DRAFT_556030 [Terfezia claveryi]|nr:hypothetical protein BGX38DRAFT_556030 [Terfezia claveryi]